MVNLKIKDPNLIELTRPTLLRCKVRQLVSISQNNQFCDDEMESSDSFNFMITSQLASFAYAARSPFSFKVFVCHFKERGSIKRHRKPQFQNQSSTIEM